MATPPVLDFDALLAPIAGDRAAGTDLRKDYGPTAVYRMIRDARNAARRTESRQTREEVPGNERPDWAPVLSETPRVIANQSKDLELTAYLVEALIRAEGYAGLRDGFRLGRELIEKYWDVLYPVWEAEVEEDELPQRVAAWAGLNGVEGDGTLIVPIRNVSLVDPVISQPIGLAKYEQAALLVNKDNAERERLLAQGFVSLEQFDKAVAVSPPAFYANLAGDIAAASNEFELLMAAFEAKCGPDKAPPASNIRDALRACKQRIDSIAGQKLGPAAVAGMAGGADMADGAHAGGGAVRSGPIQTREQAFDTLLQVARFFREAEPHSILPWQLEECVRWGRMPLPDLFRDLINDSSALEAVYKRIGIPQPENQ